MKNKLKRADKILVKLSKDPSYLPEAIRLINHMLWFEIQRNNPDKSFAYCKEPGCKGDH